MTAIDREMTATSAAQYLAEQLQDGRAYYSVLQDMRREKRVCRIPFHRGERGRALYYKSDIDAFIATEMKRALGLRPDYLVERIDDEIGSWVPPVKRIKPILH